MTRSAFVSRCYLLSLEHNVLIWGDGYIHRSVLWHHGTISSRFVLSSNALVRPPIVPFEDITLGEGGWETGLWDNKQIGRPSDTWHTFFLIEIGKEGRKARRVGQQYRAGMGCRMWHFRSLSYSYFLDISTDRWENISTFLENVAGGASFLWEHMMINVIVDVMMYFYTWYRILWLLEKCVRCSYFNGASIESVSFQSSDMHSTDHVSELEEVWTSAECR